MKKLLLFFSFAIIFSSTFSQAKRYTESIFPTSDVTMDIVYDTAPFINFPYHDESNTTDDALVMDIYEPTNDSHDLRAAIIFVHAGGFTLGNRNHDDMLAFCDSFARMGYVTATIDYRKGFYALSNTVMHSTRGAYRGLQDGRSAIRFLRANAAIYGIDPNSIYMAGSSAGAFVALNSIYMTDTTEIPTDAREVEYSNLIFPFSHTAPNLGLVDRGSNLGQSGSPNGVISLWGAVSDLALMNPGDTQAIFMAHGSSDPTVPFEAGSPFGVGTFPIVYGSKLIDSMLISIGMTNKETYFLTGEEHEFYGTSNGTWNNGAGGNMYWDSIVNKITNFLWLQHKPFGHFSYIDNGLEVNFNDQTPGALSWLWDFGDGNTSTLENPTHVYNDEGSYVVKLFVQNDIHSWDEVEIPVAVFGAVGVTKSGEEEKSFSFYPNPTNDKIYLKHPATSPQWIDIYSVQGVLLKSKMILGSAQMDLSDLPAGMYFIKNRGGAVVQKLIKK